MSADMWTRLQWDASTGADLSPGDPVAAWAVREIQMLRNDNARLVSTAKPGGPACITCAAHLVVINDLRSLIRRIIVDGWSALAPHEREEIAMIVAEKRS